MSQLTTLIRSLGNPGAVANARSVLEARRQEDRIVSVLAAHLNESPDVVVPATVPAVRYTASHPAHEDGSSARRVA